ncbi:UNVERIFIED_CONTAM: Transcription factor [Sesamum angustifolium]|uniref:Transcription factor n=1 Tax=Sesamum angustifolium TaxID=2727405 RepID=A0AAW2RPX6_9LAMI
MEITQQSLLEELIMTPKIDNNNWIPFPNEFFPSSWSFAPFDHQTPDQQHLDLPTVANPSILQLISPAEFGHPCPFLDALTLPEISSFYEMDDVAAMPPVQEEYVEEMNSEVGFLDNVVNGFFKVENGQVVDALINMDEVGNDVGEKKSRAKKPNGQPSKNLMAERRRRKRLNDRLSMLRSIVPKISKMDRTSILGDTIDYMRELLDKIHRLQDEGMSENLNHTINLTANSSKDLKPNQVLVRNPPKFDVERRNKDTRVEVCCTAKPGLLISTLGTLDALGLDIHQCVISCFNDFSFRASCYEVGEHRSLVSSEDVKQALFRNAGYGGRCL